MAGYGLNCEFTLSAIIIGHWEIFSKADRGNPYPGVAAASLPSGLILKITTVLQQG